MSGKKKSKGKKGTEDEEELQLELEEEEVVKKTEKKKKKSKAEKKEKSAKEDKEGDEGTEGKPIEGEKKQKRDGRSDSEEDRPKVEVPDNYPVERRPEAIVDISPPVFIYKPRESSPYHKLDVLNKIIEPNAVDDKPIAPTTNSVIQDEKPTEITTQRSRKTQLFVTKYPYNTTEEDLTEYFANFGEIKELYMKRGGYAFIDYFNPEASERAVKNRTVLLKGMLPLVEIALDRAQTESSRGKGPRPPRSDDDCWICKERGHFSYECPFKLRRGGGRATNPRSSFYEDQEYRDRSRERDYVPNAPKEREFTAPPREDRDYGYMPKRSYYEKGPREEDQRRTYYRSRGRNDSDYRSFDRPPTEREVVSSSYARDYLPRGRDESPRRSPERLRSPERGYNESAHYQGSSTSGLYTRSYLYSEAQPKEHHSNPYQKSRSPSPVYLQSNGERFGQSGGTGYTDLGGITTTHNDQPQMYS